MTASGWKAKVLERHPKAVVLNEPERPAGPSRYVCHVEPGGDVLAVSVASIGDAWRAAWINISTGTPADQAPGSSLLL